MTNKESSWHTKAPLRCPSKLFQNWSPGKCWFCDQNARCKELFEIGTRLKAQGSLDFMKRDVKL